MKITKIVLKEATQRSNQLISSLLAITLGITIIIGIKNITHFLEKAVGEELDSLGSNILILPKSSTIDDYYSADFQNEVMPENFVDIIIDSPLEGINNISPKLTVPVIINEKTIKLTGILPKNEFKSKITWQLDLNLINGSEGCGKNVNIPGVNEFKKNLVRNKVIDDLGKNEILLGNDLAKFVNKNEGDIIKILNRDFKIIAILPETGTVDDNRIFAHLHTVQEMSNKKSVINAIEIVGCCSSIAEGLIPLLKKLLPEAKVITITQIVQTQIKTNKLMNKLSLVILIIVTLIGGLTIANYMFANVYERRREIGILMSMGAKPVWIIKIFMIKVLLIGVIGGVAGYILGTIMAIILGPQFSEIKIYPLPILALYGLMISISISVLASIIPVIKSTKIDPYVIIQE